MSACDRRAEVLALIPARGGSKSIPRKNLVVVAGKPLIAYSIEQALASRLITRTIVSTDDEEIADVARACGAEVPFMRPGAFALDESTDLEVFRHVLQELDARQGYACELVVHLRPTGPVRRVEPIDRAIEIMLGRPDAHSLRSVSLAEQTPYKMWRMVDGELQPLLQVPGMVEPCCAPRQTLPEAYWQNGYVDIVRPHVVLGLGRMAGERVLPFIVDEPVVELDYPESLPRLEQALGALGRGEWPPARPAGARHPV
ncbi:MAG: acylneuraminate cytidylyltransferase family protein [Acidimicrobiia bacterium]|nr:acylneuraminate cytidylyltransferase family protein [Acidimicrobiia bacterium]